MAVTTHHAIPTSNNVNQPNVKRLVYNMYRDMLGSYNDKANDIVDSLPRQMVRKDQGITQQIESMIQQQANSPNYGDYGNDQPCFAGPPPPPPPPGPCNVPSKRLSTEIPDRRLEPPACVQNAMMTKDKKPFTYTPGGLDLSQIKSPRMARRISRNAQAEGVSEPRQSPLAQPHGQLPPSALAAMQPNLPTQVFPPGGIPPPPPPPSNAGPIQSPPPPPPINNIQPSVNRPVPPPQNFQRPDIKSIIPPNPTAMLRQTGGPMRRGPYPTEPVDEPTSPEKLQSSNNTLPANKPQLGSLYIPPVKNQEIEETRNIQSPARNIHTPPTVQSPVLNKAPTPWLTQRVQPQQQSNVPAWAHREDSEPKSPPTVITKVAPVPIDQSAPRSNNVSSIQIQHRPQVYLVNPPQQQQQHPMSPVYVVNPPQQQQHPMSPVYVVNPPQQQQHSMSPGPQGQKNSRIIPIQIEGSNSPTQMSPAVNISRNDSVSQPQWRSNGNVQRTQEIPNNQFRKLQLQDDDQNLMNKFKNQVDEDTFLHNETDPRYRGAAIPSRAFRMLQTMTDTGSDPIPQYSNAPRNSPGPVIRTIPIQREGDDVNVQQQYIPPSEQQAPAEPRKYTGSTIPSRSFRMLQAMTSPNNTPCANTQSTENVENYANDPYYSQWGGYDPNYPPHPYWNNPYWAYYSQQCYSPQLQQENQDENQTGDQNVEQTEQDMNAQYQQYWDQYGYYYNYYPYPYPPVYSPHPFYHQNSDTDNEGAYSSCDEMTYYGALFANKPPKIPQKVQSETPNIIVTTENSAEIMKSQNNEIKNVEKANSISDSSESESDSESDADTEVEDQKPIKTKSGSLLAIKSVSDINIYEDNNNYPDTTDQDQDTNDADSNDESTEENDDEYSAYEDEEIPHQLSVIFEDDNEVSDYDSVRGKKPRQDSEHTLVSEEESFVTVGNGESDTDEEEVAHTQSTVTVKLPLKLNCSRNEQNEPITTITVEPTSEVIETHFTLKSPTPNKDKLKEDVSFTINIPSRKNSFETQNNSVTDTELIDAIQDSDVSISVSLSLKKISDHDNDSSDQLKCKNKLEEDESESEEESDSDSDDEGSSSSSGDSSSDSSSESDSEVENVKDEKDDINEISEKEKQQILKLLARAKGIEKDETISINVKDKIKSFEMHIRNESSNSTRNSSKSIVDMTDEEDSGVTSDMSRHISDTDSSECFPELRKMNKYRRAATHSRLFQLLQEEYNSKDDDENETQTVNENNITSMKESLTLTLSSALHNDQEESSSGINSPISPTINDRLVKELVQSLLKRKKGKCFRNLPLEKLHAAALRILQEDMDRCDTISSSEDGGSTAFLSPLPTETVNSSPVHTPQEFFNGNYDDYSAYYSSWANIASDSENYDILPSRTFKQLQDHGTGTKPYKNTILAKCPRVLSGKNLHKELQKVTETRETPSPLLESNPDNKIEARAT